MKKLFLLLTLLSAFAHSFAYRFEGRDRNSHEMYFNTISDTEVEVTYISLDQWSNYYNGNIKIPSEVNSRGKTYKVTKIGDYTFHDCRVLSDVEIPNTVTEIGKGAFVRCFDLWAIKIPASVRHIGEGAFAGNLYMRQKAEFASINSLCSIKFDDGQANPLQSAKSLYINGREVKDVVIPETVKSIGDYAFYWSKSITSVTIPNSVETIGKYAFFRCYEIRKNIIIPNSVTSIGNGAFDETNGPNYIIGDNLRELGTQAFPKRKDLYAHKGTYTLLSLWNGDYNIREYDIREIGTNIPLPKPTLKIRAYPNKAEVAIRNFYSEYTYYMNGKQTDSLFTIKQSINNPNDSIAVAIRKDDMECPIIGKFKTPAISLITWQPKVISKGNVILQALSNIEGKENNVGFEVRCTDWTDDTESKNAMAYLYEGELDSYIENISTEKNWKVRPFYEDYEGNRLYGEWATLNPKEVGNYEPVVHTYNEAAVNGNSVTLKGFAIRGTSNAKKQGFAYWKSNNKQSSTKAMRALTVPDDAHTTEANNMLMEATISGLNYNTKYNYAAFVVSEDGNISYGVIRSFTTGEVPVGITCSTTEKQEPNIVGIYDLTGRKLKQKQHGVNIIRYSNGTARKVLVK